MSIFIKELSDNKFEIIIIRNLQLVNETYSFINEYYDNLTKKKNKKEALISRKNYLNIATSFF